MLQGGLALVQLRRGRVEVGSIAWRVTQVHPGDIGFHLRLVGELREGNHDVAAHAVGDSNEIAWGQLVDERVGRATEHLVALGRLGRLQDEHHRHWRFLHVLRKLDLDGKGRLERRAGVAAGSIAFRATDHDETQAKIARRRLQQRHAVYAEACRGDVQQDDRLIRGEVCCSSRHLAGQDRGRRDPRRGQGGLEVRRFTGRLLHDQHARRADDLDQRLADVVLRVRVEDWVDGDSHAVEPGPCRFECL